MSTDLARSMRELFRGVDPSPVWERLFAALPDVVFCIKDLGFRDLPAHLAAACRALHRESR